jgi:Protein of unknown function (DUF1552)
MIKRPSRRTFLHGAGVTMALPWLESLPVWGAATEVFPQRFAAMFMGNGISGNHWWAQGSGADLKLSRSLEPLNPVKKKINVINGLFNKSAVGMGVHPAQTGNILSGMPLQKGPIVKAGITMDQVLAKQLGKASLVLACEQPAAGYHETDFSMVYSSHISWNSADSPVPLEVDPSRAFDSLFENRGNFRNQSVLDRVKDGAATVRRQVCRADEHRLDGYLTGVREVEKRVVAFPEDVRDRMRLMCDIVALAFQADRARVASLLLSRDLSSLHYPFLDVRENHHDASHDDLSDGYERICRFHVSQMAYLANRLDAMPEGEGTVLDNSCILFLSNMWSGWKHDNMKLPVVMAGGLGGTIETGRALDCLYAGDENRKLCSLYLSLMDRMGVKLDRFGDADTRLADL